ncbi:three-helix bundle dimerization domain-containing protein [Nocardioides sp. P5_C9_2]
MTTTDVRRTPAGPAEAIAKPGAPDLGEAALTHAIGLVSARLMERFPSVSATVVAEVVGELRGEFDGSRVRSFVPILVERLARDRLAALQAPNAARSDLGGPGTRPRPDVILAAPRQGGRARRGIRRVGRFRGVRPGGTTADGRGHARRVLTINGTDRRPSTQHRTGRVPCPSGT